MLALAVLTVLVSGCQLHGERALRTLLRALLGVAHAARHGDDVETDSDVGCSACQCMSCDALIGDKRLRVRRLDTASGPWAINMSDSSAPSELAQSRTVEASTRSWATGRRASIRHSYRRRRKPDPTAADRRDPQTHACEARLQQARSPRRNGDRRGARRRLVGASAGAVSDVSRGLSGSARTAGCRRRLRRRPGWRLVILALSRTRLCRLDTRGERLKPSTGSARRRPDGPSTLARPLLLSSA